MIRIQSSSCARLIHQPPVHGLKSRPLSAYLCSFALSWFAPIYRKRGWILDVSLDAVWAVHGMNLGYVRGLRRWFDLFPEDPPKCQNGSLHSRSLFVSHVDGYEHGCLRSCGEYNLCFSHHCQGLEMSGKLFHFMCTSATESLIKI